MRQVEGAHVPLGKEIAARLVGHECIEKIVPGARIGGGCYGGKQLTATVERRNSE